MREPTACNTPEPLAYRVNDAARLIGVGVTSLYKLASEGKIKLIKIAGRTLVTAESLRTLVAWSE